MRGEAILSLGKLGNPAMLDPLRARFASGQGEESMRIAQAIKDLGDPRFLQEEVARLSEAARTSEDEAVRADAVKMLARYAPEEAREVLDGAASDASARVRKEAEKALRDAGKKKR